ncbi:MAG: DUF2959 domain-containing protein [Planctomycetes bacterium]|nr:DUF2959 domain-containing protein [Planctomycetota bacterium]MCB9872302.1 DUF2959 domain-containing protein [Planctomycetota bacterium]
MNRTRIVVITTVLAGLGACSSVYYRAMDAMGYAKRDILVGRVEKAQASQNEAKQQFQTTLEAFKALTGFDGGELEAQYNKLKSAYDASKVRATAVSTKIRDVEDVAGAMFSEWEKETAQITDAGMRSQSAQMRAQTQGRYNEMLSKMKAAEARMPPVLEAFNNHVLFLKHHLNAQAIKSLDKQVLEIESNVSSLIADMQKSIDEADRFIKALPKNG